MKGLTDVVLLAKIKLEAYHGSFAMSMEVVSLAFVGFIVLRENNEIKVNPVPWSCRRFLARNFADCVGVLAPNT